MALLVRGLAIKLRLLKWDKTNQGFIPLLLYGGVKPKRLYPASFMEVSL